MPGPSRGEIVVNHDAGSSIAPGQVARHDARSAVQRVLAGALTLLSTQPITWACSLLTAVYLPRLIDGQAYGEYGIAAAFTGLVGSLLSLGLPTALTRRIAARPETTTSDATGALVLQVGLGLAASAVCMLVLPWTGVLKVSPSLLPLAYVGMIVVLVQNVLLAVLTGQQQIGRYAWLTVVTTVVVTLLSIVLLALGGGAVGLQIAVVVPTLVIVVVGWKRFGIGFDLSTLSRASMRTLAVIGLPFLGWNVLIRFRTESDVVFLGWLLTAQSVGVWNVAQKISFMPIFVPTMIMTPLLPVLSRLVHDRITFARVLRHSFDASIILTVFISASLFAVAPILPSFLGWPAEYGASARVIQLLAPVLPLIAIGMVLGTGLIALGDERRWLLANGVATATMFPLLYFGIPLAQERLGDGLIGAAVARTMPELVMVVAALVLLPRWALPASAWLVPIRVMIAGAVLIGVAMLVGERLWPLGIAAGSLAFVLLLLGLGVTRPADLVLALAWARARMRRRSSDPRDQASAA
jgi:O-antigen/teichoic acid export membrane protein